MFKSTYDAHLEEANMQNHQRKFFELRLFLLFNANVNKTYFVFGFFLLRGMGT